MAVDVTIQKDIRSLILSAIPEIAVFDRHAFTLDTMPYVTFGPIQTVRNHAGGSRFKIFYVTLHLWVRNADTTAGSRNVAELIIDTLDMKKLTESGLDCYFEDSMPVYEDDTSIIHTVISFEVR